MIDAYPIWSPDGARLAFGSIRGTAMNLYWKSLTQSAAEQPLLVTAETKAATDWSRDGRFILFRSSGRDTGYDLWALPLNAGGAGTPVLVAGGVFDERDGQFSPDGRWIAYQSNESDRTEVYIRRFPTADRPVRISSDGGAQPRWSRDGAQLFYVSLEGRLVSVPVTLGADSQSTTVGAPESLFFANVGSALQGAVRQQYLVAPDGDRFLCQHGRPGTSSADHDRRQLDRSARGPSSVVCAFLPPESLLLKGGVPPISYNGARKLRGANGRVTADTPPRRRRLCQRVAPGGASPLRPQALSRVRCICAEERSGETRRQDPGRVDGVLRRSYPTGIRLPSVWNR